MLTPPLRQSPPLLLLSLGQWCLLRGLFWRVLPSLLILLLYCIPTPATGDGCAALAKSCGAGDQDLMCVKGLYNDADSCLCLAELSVAHSGVGTCKTVTTCSGGGKDYCAANSTDCEDAGSGIKCSGYQSDSAVMAGVYALAAIASLTALVTVIMLVVNYRARKIRQRRYGGAATGGGGGGGEGRDGGGGGGGGGGGINTAMALRAAAASFDKPSTELAEIALGAGAFQGAQRTPQRMALPPSDAVISRFDDLNGQNEQEKDEKQQQQQQEEEEEEEVLESFDGFDDKELLLGSVGGGESASSELHSGRSPPGPPSARATAQSNSLSLGANRSQFQGRLSASIPELGAGGGREEWAGRSPDSIGADRREQNQVTPSPSPPKVILRGQEGLKTLERRKLQGRRWSTSSNSSQTENDGESERRRAREEAEAKMNTAIQLAKRLNETLQYEQGEERKSLKRAVSERTSNLLRKSSGGSLPSTTYKGTPLYVKQGRANMRRSWGANR